MQYLKSTHHIKSENIHVQNISHNAVLISYTYTYTYTYTYRYTYTYTHIHIHIHIHIHMHTHTYACTYTYTYTSTHTYVCTKTHIHIYIHIHTYTYIHMHKMNYYLRMLCLSIFWFKKDWYINFPNHVNIWESVHVIRKMNFSLFVKLACDGSLFFSLLVNNARSTSLSLQTVILYARYRSFVLASMC